MAKMTLNILATLGLLRPTRFAWFLVPLLGGEFFQLSSASGSNVTVPSEFIPMAKELRNYMCNNCSDETLCEFSFGCTFCQWLCQSRWGQWKIAEHTVCQKNPGSSTLCDDDQSMYCMYGEEAEVCEYDESDESCMYYYSFDVLYKYCLCRSDRVQGRFAVTGMSCSDQDLDSTTIRTKTEVPPTRQQLTTVNGAATLIGEPLTTGEPLSAANVAAIVLGTVLAVLLIAVALGLLCLFRTNRLKCAAGTGVTTSDAAIEMTQNDNECARGQRSVVSTNAYEDTSTWNGTTEHAYKSLQLSHEQSHYYSRISEGRCNPDARTAQEEVTPSAPPMEGHELTTDAQEGHEYFVLEREQSKRSKEENSNHEYFVLEKDDCSGRQEEGAEDTKSLGKEVDIISKPAATQEGYDHIKRSPQDNTTDNTYSRLNPHPEKEYDHLSRPGKT